MINLNIVFLLVVGLAVAYAWEPDCTNCKYYNGIGFVKDDTYCAVYYVCYKNPYSHKHRNSTIKYEYKVQCCPDGLVWDEEHLTCIWKKWGDDCNTTRYKCPKIPTTTNLPCPYTKVDGDKTKYFVKHTHQVRMCPYGEVWHEDNCTCYFGKHFRPRTCDKLLHFDFNDTFDSDSCYNFAKGDPYGDAYINHNALCVNGSGMLSIGFLNNWWAWNPIGKKFTICFWFRPYSLDDQGIVSLNCEHDTDPGSVLEACIKGSGNLWIQLGTFDYDFGPVDKTEYTKVCVTYHHGVYEVFINGAKKHPVNHDGIIKNVKPPPNGQVATTLGYVKNWPAFRGYIDDFCFWIRVLSDEEIFKCFHKGRSV